MAKKKKVETARVAAVDEAGLLKRDLGNMLVWLVISVVIAAVVGIGIDKLL